MGIQSVTIRYLGIPGVVTTYISGTITMIVGEIVKNFKSIFYRMAKPAKETLPKKMEQRMDLQVLIFFSYLGMTVITTLVYLWGLDFLPLLPLLLILSSIIIVIRQFKPPSI